MDIERVDHYSIRTDDLERSRRFYTEVIGLTEGPRPPFDFPGYWLYAGEHPIVHLMGYNPQRRGTLDAHVGERKAAAGGGTGAFDHVAFAATNKAGLIERCRRNDVPYRERTVPQSNLTQVFLQDPDGLTIEVNYRS